MIQKPMVFQGTNAITGTTHGFLAPEVVAKELDVPVDFILAVLDKHGVTVTVTNWGLYIMDVDFDAMDEAFHIEQGYK